MDVGCRGVRQRPCIDGGGPLSVDVEKALDAVQGAKHHQGVRGLNGRVGLGHPQDVLPDTRLTVFPHLLKLPSNRDQTQLVAVGQFQIGELPSVAGCRRFELCDFVIVWQGQEPPNVRIDETFAHHFRNLAFRAQDFRDAQAAQDAFLVGVVRPNDHPRQPQVEQVQRGQQMDVMLNAAGEERAAMNVMLTDPDVLADYVNDFFGPEGPYPTMTAEEEAVANQQAARQQFEAEIEAQQQNQVPPNFQRPEQEMPQRGVNQNPAQSFWGDFSQMMDSNPEQAWQYLAQAPQGALQTKALIQDL